MNIIRQNFKKVVTEGEKAIKQYEAFKKEVEKRIEKFKDNPYQQKIYKDYVSQINASISAIKCYITYNGPDSKQYNMCYGDW